MTLHKISIPRNLVLLMLLLTAIDTHAQIFKCKGPDGKTFYQDKSCPATSQTSLVTVEKINPEKITNAQIRLTEELDKIAIAQEIQRRKLLKERELEALERTARANEDVAKATWYQAKIDQERNNQVRSNSYFYGPIYPKPRHRYKPGMSKTQPAKPINKPATKSLRYQR